MKKAAVVLLVLVAVMMIAPAAFAQGGATGEKAPLSPGTLALAAGFGVAIAAVGGGPGQGGAAAAAWGGRARNPRGARGVRGARLPGRGFWGAPEGFTVVWGVLLFL